MISMTHNGNIDCQDCGIDTELSHWVSDCKEKHILCNDCAYEYNRDELHNEGDATC